VRLLLRKLNLTSQKDQDEAQNVARFQAEALLALQEACESAVVSLF